MRIFLGSLFSKVWKSLSYIFVVTQVKSFFEVSENLFIKTVKGFLFWPFNEIFLQQEKPFGTSICTSKERIKKCFHSPSKTNSGYIDLKKKGFLLLGTLIISLVSLELISFA